MKSTNIGSKIKRIRTSQGLSRKELADKSGLNHEYLGRLERWEERYRNPSIQNLQSLSEALKTDLKILLS